MTSDPQEAKDPFVTIWLTANLCDDTVDFTEAQYELKRLWLRVTPTLLGDRELECGFKN